MSVFSHERLNHNTYRIFTPGCDCYLLEGDNEAIMIDSGMSDKDIRAYVQSITALPVRRVINTHSHFDHTAGNGFFEVIYGTVGISRSAKNTMGAPFSMFPLDYTFTLVKDGDTIDLAGRELTVIELDCHAPGNLAILDKTGRMLFAGDELESGQVLLLPGYAEEMGQIHAKPAASVETYLHAMQKIAAFDADFDIICPSHNGSPIGKEWLYKYIALAEKILGGYEGKTDCSSKSYNARAGHYPNPDAGYRRGEHEGASLIYCSELIFDADYAKADTLPPATRLHLICKDFALQ